jgi:hypothetical protein
MQRGCPYLWKQLDSRLDRCARALRECHANNGIAIRTPGRVLHDQHRSDALPRQRFQGRTKDRAGQADIPGDTRHDQVAGQVARKAHNHVRWRAAAYDDVRRNTGALKFVQYLGFSN